MSNKTVGYINYNIYEYRLLLYKEMLCDQGMADLQKGVEVEQLRKRKAD